MRLFFQMLVEYAKIKWGLRCNYVKLKAELDIYVYEKKQQIYKRIKP